MITCSKRELISLYKFYNIAPYPKVKLGLVLVVVSGFVYEQGANNGQMSIHNKNSMPGVRCAQGSFWLMDKMRWFFEVHRLSEFLLLHYPYATFVFIAMTSNTYLMSKVECCPFLLNFCINIECLAEFCS